jgi:hypothetical protein
MERPSPVGGLRFVDAVLKGVVRILDDLVLQPVFEMRLRDREPRDPVDHIDGQVEAAYLIAHGKVEGRIDIPLLLVAPHVQVLMIRPAIGELVDEPRIAVKIEYDRPVECKEAVEIAV